MPLNPPPTIETGLGLVSLSLERSDMSRAAQVTFALNVAGVPDASVAQDAVDDFRENFLTYWAPFIDDEVTIQEAQIRLGDGSTTPFEAVSTVTSNAGGVSQVSLPPNVALLVKKTTGVGGRKNRGRTYIPFLLPESVVSENGTIAGATVTALNVQAAAFLSQLSADGNPMCISHKVFNVPLAPHFVTAIHTGPLVTTYKVEPMIATQRRRLGR
jgi:hypothetical protein